MNKFYGFFSVAAVIVTAACNSGGEGNGSAVSNETAPAAQNVAAGTASPADHAAVMKARHDHYEAMGRAMKGIGDQLKASSPAMPEIQRHAAVLAGYGPQILQWFPEGSGPEAGRTRAKAEIWSDASNFQSAARQYEQAAGAFNAAAQSGDLEAVKAAMPALGNSCKTCHDKYRGPEQD